MAPVEYEFPVSPAQARMLVLDQLNPGTAQYNVPVAFAVRGPFDVAAFRAALDVVVARHESLRTVFRPGDGAYVQVVAEEAEAALRVLEVPAAGVHEVLRAEAAVPFDVEVGPLLRCVVYVLDDGSHLVLLTAHHLVCDGWSLRLLLQELADAYHPGTTAPASSVTAPVSSATAPDQGTGMPEPPPVQYADYAAWQRERLDAHALDAAVAYWADSLADAPGTLALPTDHPRPAVQSTAGGVHRLNLPPDLRERLAKVAAERNATPFTAMFAAFAAFLSRITGQRDFVVGVPVAGRDHPGLQGLIGLLANTLALRAEVAGEPSFLDLVTRVRDRLLAAHPHQEAPFEAVVEALAPGRELSHDPLVQVMLAYDDDTRLALDLRGCVTERVELLLDDAKFDLLLNVQRDGDGLAAHFVHRADLFERETVRHWAHAFETLLDGLLDRPDLPVTAHDLLAAGERHRVLHEWNRAAAPVPAGLVPDLVAERAAERPDATALVCGSVRLTYRELLERADGLAAGLRAAGVGPEVPVGLCLSRGAGMAVAALGVLRAGGAYVPLDPGHPEARLRFMIEDAGVRLLITDGPEGPGAPADTAGNGPGAFGVPVTTVDGGAIPSIGPATDARPTLRDTAYILYTSGSTGRPKGVAVEHRALLNLATAVRPQFPVTSEDRVLQYVSFGFDVAVSDLFFTFVAGAELHVAAECERLGEDLYARLRDSRITYAFLPPSAAMSLPYPPDGWRDAQEEGLPELRTLAIGGEACPPELVARWATARRRVVDAYGPSENTVYATTADLVPGRPVVIGRPVANTRAYVLDGRLRPVPVGVTGEIYLAGANLARGYANRPALTAERFVADPFGPPGERMYRTGDLGRYDADGVLSYLGRVDTQVKLRGFRVELGEIETVLAAHPGVAMAAAAVRGDRLAVYVVPTAGLGTEPDAAPDAGSGVGPDAGPGGGRRGGPLTVVEVRSWLGARLPGYMVPDAVVFVPELPVSKSGKVDRQRLPEPPLTRPDLDSPYVPPGTPTERRIAGVWAAALDLTQVGLHDNFFDLGGNSIRLLAVLAALREDGRNGGRANGQADGRADGRAGGRDGGIKLVDLFRHPTVATLAAFLDGTGPGAGDEPEQRGRSRRERLAARRNAQRGEM
ncbi:non-ribosomal peptide synthetase [Nonomuraea gerenzanensis]|uniref:Non-ribosomal peptide synthetase n=1 Tax=Nonomuraea gerenzanensis TaxID=93944 RepID=A0A1M4E7R9_9ACTN|nr:non-ribosomal peptide synthetase [Nonomuraea gerenzanensis]UBU17187.1 amino acid adenylation domain-containing protein [Nonomuraea gerenzanensis]SBO94927.1 non-ribosomal peptide synthetase [Nonomuraea gerenzanensis]